VVTVIAKDVNDEEVAIDSKREVLMSVWPGGGLGNVSAAAKLSANLQPGPAKVAEAEVMLERPWAGSFVVDGGDSIPDMVTVPYGVARGGRVSYVANGEVPYGAGPEPVTIWAWVEDLGGSWKSGVVEARVMAEELCPVVEFAKRRIGPGDTVRVAMKGKKADGTIVDYRSERIFDLQITEGGEYGTLRIVEWGGRGSSFEEVTQPFEFIAVDSLTVDSAVVRITGYPSPSGSGSEGGEMSMRAADDETRPVVGLRKGSKEEKAARAELLARTLAANTCEEPVGEVVIVKSKKQLKIVDHGPWEIWPYLPPQSNGDSRGADRPGYNPKQSFERIEKTTNGDSYGARGSKGWLHPVDRPSRRIRTAAQKRKLI
jgi:hypothetical protein